MSLPARFGGLSIFNPTIECKFSHDNSALVSLPLVRLIMRQEAKLDPLSLQEEVKEIRKQIDNMAEKRHKERYENLYARALLKCNGILVSHLTKELRTG